MCVLRIFSVRLLSAPRPSPFPYTTLFRSPFSATANHGTRGMIYEPLILVSPMTEDDGQPWLAESMEFNEDGTVATFTLRERSEEHTSELQSRGHIVCRLLLEKKKV